MAFVLEKKEDMQNIYEMAKKVYDLPTPSAQGKRTTLGVCWR